MIWFSFNLVHSLYQHMYNVYPVGNVDNDGHVENANLVDHFDYYDHVDHANLVNYMNYHIGNNDNFDPFSFYHGKHFGWPCSQF